MNGDDKILLISFIGYWLVLITLTIKSKNKPKTASINTIIHLAYSSFFLYGLYYKSQGGNSLLWFFCLVFIIWIHSAINLVQLIFALKNKIEDNYL